MRFLPVPTVLSVLFLLVGHAEAMGPAKVFEKVSDSVVTVFSREDGRDVAVGTGIVTHPFGSTLTNFQAAQRKPLFVRLQSGDVIPVAKVVAQDPEMDLALLVLDTSRKFIPVTLAAKLPKPGSPVAVLDGLWGFRYMRSKGNLISVGNDGETLRITAAPSLPRLG